MKMYFYYGVMGSSKTAVALMKKFSFEEHGKKVVLLKPSTDTREGRIVVKSRIGLSCEALVVSENESIMDLLMGQSGYDIIIVDEAQFLNPNQVDELRDLTNSGIMVMCLSLIHI